MELLRILGVIIINLSIDKRQSSEGCTEGRSESIHYAMLCCLDDYSLYGVLPSKRCAGYLIVTAFEACLCSNAKNYSTFVNRNLIAKINEETI